MADPLIALIQRKVSLHNAVWIAPICHTSVWVVRGARYLSAPHGQNPPTAHRISHCLSRWHYTIQIKLGWALFVTYTEYNEEWNVFSAFNPFKCTHLEQWAADCAAPEEQSWTSCRSRDPNTQPWVTSGFKSNALCIRPTTALIIYSQEWQWHMMHLREVLRALRGAGLTANPKKCAIGRVEVRYLGFHLGHGQVRPQIDRTAAIAACPRPKTKKEVRQFLGLAGYYRRFIPDYSELTSPLTDLTKKEVPDTVPWTERCQQAFTQVKAALCGGPLLHSPDFSLPFLLQTDASDRGLGAVLTQEIGGEERPVLYISRKLSKWEAMYSTIEKECLAIRWAVLTLRYYLLGREFTLCSDHAPLQWLHRMKDTNARITCWYLALQPFKFKVIHRPGTQMTVADFLSRNGGGGGCSPEGFPAWVGRWGYVARGRGSAKSAAGERLRRQR